jgi:hypothetical protein
MVRDGNVLNIPHSVDDVHWLYDIYGPQVEGLQGRTTHNHATRKSTADPSARIERTNQELTMDVMHIKGVKFLVSISSPLELLMICHVKALDKESIGVGVQSHILLLRSRGFIPWRIFVDTHKTLASLIGM